MEMLYAIVGLAVGLGIGWSFGWFQMSALRRHQTRQNQGQFKGAIGVVPGSMKRVAFLLFALMVAQISFPQLFPGVSKWFVSAGVVFGYGWILFKNFRERRARGT